MSRLDEPVDRGHVVQSARLTIAGHQRGRCQVCAADGCRQLDWARDELARITPTVDRLHKVAGVARRTE